MSLNNSLNVKPAAAVLVSFIQVSSFNTNSAAVSASFTHVLGIIAEPAPEITAGCIHVPEIKVKPTAAVAARY